VGSRLRDRLGVEAAPAMMASLRASQPSSPAALRLYSEALMSLRRFDATSARTLLDKAIQVEPKLALAYSALATSWATLGYDERARASAKEAFDLSASLPRAERLHVEGTYHEMASEWKDAIATWQSLATFFPDDVEYVLRLADAQIQSGAAKEGMATVESFRKRFPSVRDPRLGLSEAAAAETLSDFKRQQVAAAAAGVMGEAQGARLVVARARMLEGGALLRQGQRDGSVRLFEEARRIYEVAGDRAGVSRALNNIASALSEGPDPKRAVALYEEGLAIARTIGDQRQVGRFLNNLAIQRRRQGDLQGSLKMNQESLALRREIGDRTNMAISLNNIGNVLLDLGDLEGASTHYQQSAEMSREIGDRRSLARALHNAAVALKEQGEIAQSRATVEEALRIRRTIDDPGSVAISLYGLGETAAVQGDLSTARRSVTEALEIERRLDRPRNIAFALHLLGDVAFAEGDLEGAGKHYADALAIATKVEEKVEAAAIQEALAILALETRRPNAEALAREAADVFKGQGAPDSEATARAILALALLAQDRRDIAQGEIDRARTLVPNPQHVLTRLPVAIAAAQIEARSNPASALRALEAVRDEASKRSIPRFEFDARRAIAEIEGRRSSAAGMKLLDAIRSDAKARGFGLYARP
jgi:tetratricopeptide (TPR) repeat protein